MGPAYEHKLVTNPSEIRCTKVSGLGGWVPYLRGIPRGPATSLSESGYIAPIIVVTR